MTLLLVGTCVALVILLLNETTACKHMQQHILDTLHWLAELCSAYIDQTR